MVKIGCLYHVNNAVVKAKQNQLSTSTDWPQSDTTHREWTYHQVPVCHFLLLLLFAFYTRINL